MDGLEVLASLKQIYPDIKVIIPTWNGSFEAWRKGVDPGACDYLMKSVDLNLSLASRPAHLVKN